MTGVQTCALPISNVVNASDINEMPSNALYVMGVTIDDLLSGYVGLAPVRKNRIAVVVNRPIPNEIVNIVSAARATLGIEAFVVGLPERLRMVAGFDADGAATGNIDGAQEAAEYLQRMDEEFDAVAVLTEIEVERSVAVSYVRERRVNPWGGVEAKLTRIMTNVLKVPCAHAPCGHTLGDDFNEIVDPRLAAEMVSVTYAFCILKGLHQAPEITDGSFGLQARDIDALVTPAGCFGVPHEMCVKRGIPIISVLENTVHVRNPTEYPHIEAATYMEAAGILLAIREGIGLSSIGRPLESTIVLGV